MRKTEARVKRKKQRETSDKKQKNGSTLTDSFRILLEEKPNDAEGIRDRTRTTYMSKKTNYR